MRTENFCRLDDRRDSAVEEGMTSRSQTRKEASRPTSLLSSRHLRMGSWNVRTLYETGKLALLKEEAVRYNLDVVGVSEVRWILSGKTTIDNYTFLYSGHKENEAPHTLGVGILLSPLAQKALISWEPHGPRIMTATFRTKNPNIKCNLLQCYAPTEAASSEDKDDFYGLLQQVTARFSRRDILIVSGDLNAKVGSDNRGHERVMGKHGIGEDNENGERLIDFCATNDLVIGGTLFAHKNIHKGTWVSPDDRTVNQIDHICISGRFRSSLQDVHVARGAEINSDHYLVVGKLKLKLKKFSGKIESRRKYDVRALKDQSVKEDFSIELRNRFEALENLPDNIDDHWGKVREVYQSVCEEKLGCKKRIRKEWITPATWKKVEERREWKTKMLNSRTRAKKTAATEEYKRVNKETKDALKKDKREYVESLADKAEEAASQGNWKEVYDTTRILSGKFGRGEVPVKDAAGNSIPSKEAQKSRWMEHFNNLLNRPPPEHPPDIQPAEDILDINCDPPTIEEIKRAIRKQKSGKAAGSDYIPPEALKADIETTSLALHSLFTKIWEQEHSPMEWKEGHLIKLPKKGDLSNCNNYRGIMLLSVPSKVLSRVLLERMKDEVDCKLREEQAGFRKGRSCADQVAVLRIIIQQSLEWNAPLYLNFVDFEKAFDSVDHATLWKLLEHYGIPQKLVNIIRESYDGFRCRVVHEGGLTDSFEVKTGVRQGCLLSPFLFLLAIDWVMGETTRKQGNGIQWTFSSQLDDLDFADDIALLSHSHKQMQAKVDRMSTLSQSVGLKIHPGKTKVMRLKSSSVEPIRLDQDVLEDVTSFTYLGSVMDTKGGVTSDIKARIGKARQSFGRLRSVWRAPNISKKTKLRIFNSNVKSVLLYGSETWCLTKENEKRLQTFINGCLRCILGIRYPDTIRNQELLERTEQEPVADVIRKRRWGWLGHTLRRPKDHITRQALHWNPQGTRNRGRPAHTWRRELEAEIEREKFTWAELNKTAADRDRWRSLIHGL